VHALRLEQRARAREVAVVAEQQRARVEVEQPLLVRAAWLG
jgi:hypothetical protein